jgi:hypothetical protein
LNGREWSALGGVVGGIVFTAVVVGLVLMRMEWGDQVLKRLCCVRERVKQLDDDEDADKGTEPRDVPVRLCRQPRDVVDQKPSS